MTTLSRIAVTLLSIGLLQACAQYDNKRGVEVNWQDGVVANLQTGKSTRKDVMDLLGPPSQLISMDGESALYYLFAHSQGDGLVLGLYNRMTIDTRYDRAIFFFDDAEVLTEFSTHIVDDQ
ncbi:MAG: hypothetical protein HKN19_16535 [Halioglobus sp.]|nr:hypothetical protein [Halioglobus sp.]